MHETDSRLNIVCDMSSLAEIQNKKIEVGLTSKESP